MISLMLPGEENNLWHEQQSKFAFSCEFVSSFWPKMKQSNI